MSTNNIVLIRKGYYASRKSMNVFQQSRETVGKANFVKNVASLPQVKPNTLALSTMFSCAVPSVNGLGWPFRRNRVTVVIMDRMENTNPRSRN